MSTHGDEQTAEAMRKPGAIAEQGATSGTMRRHTGKRMKIAFYRLFGQQN
jgi:hypothetical protein